MPGERGERIGRVLPMVERLAVSRVVSSRMIRLALPPACCCDFARPRLLLSLGRVSKARVHVCAPACADGVTLNGCLAFQCENCRFGVLRDQT